MSATDWLVVLVAIVVGVLLLGLVRRIVAWLDRAFARPVVASWGMLITDGAKDEKEVADALEAEFRHLGAGAVWIGRYTRSLFDRIAPADRRPYLFLERRDAQAVVSTYRIGEHLYVSWNLLGPWLIHQRFGGFGLTHQTEMRALGAATLWATQRVVLDFVARTNRRVEFEQLAASGELGPLREVAAGSAPVARGGS
jgi:hypothetical protein